VTHILWLGDGIVGDDTDGHVDDLTRFVSADTVVTVVEEDPQDENYEILQDNYRRLLTMRDQDGKPLKVITLPMPAADYIEEQRLPMSYANFYIANEQVLLPTYRDKNDARALEILQRCFSHHRVTGIDCKDLIWGLGSIHCISQQQPSL
jgi:agmatine deiminase